MGRAAPRHREQSQGIIGSIRYVPLPDTGVPGAPNFRREIRTAAGWQPFEEETNTIDQAAQDSAAAAQAAASAAQTTAANALALAQGAQPAATLAAAIAIAARTWQGGLTGEVARTVEQELRDGLLPVKAFGAVGNGIADDRAAVQAALNAVAALYSYNSSAATRYRGTARRLRLPAGKYAIGAGLHLTQFYGRIEADGAILIPHATYDLDDPEMFALDTPDGTAWELTIEGLQFDGFPRAIDLTSSNRDGGHTRLIDVQFHACGLGARVDAQSSQILFWGCKWFDCDKFLQIVAGDYVTVWNCWGSAGQLANDGDGFFEVQAGRLYLEQFCGVPSVQTADEPAWVVIGTGTPPFGSAATAVYMSHFRGGGEGGSFTLVNCKAAADAAYPVTPTVVSINLSEAYHANPAGAPTVRLFEIPNQLTLRNNVGIIDRPLVAAASGVSLASKVNAAARYVIDVPPNNAFPDESLVNVPPALRPFLTGRSGWKAAAWNAGTSRLEVTVDLGLTHERIAECKGPSYVVEFTAQADRTASVFYTGHYIGLLLLTQELLSGNAVTRAQLVPLVNRASQGGDGGAFTPTVVWTATGDNAATVGILYSNDDKRLTLRFDRVTADSIGSVRVSELGAAPLL